MSSEKNGAKILWFGSVVFILQPVLETQSFTKFVKSARIIYGGFIAVHKFSLCFVCTDQWASGQQCMEVRKSIIPDWTITRTKGNWKWLCFEKWPLNQNHSTNSMILVHHSFQKTMFYLMKLIFENIAFLKYIFHQIKVTKIERSSFWDTRYNMQYARKVQFVDSYGYIITFW